MVYDHIMDKQLITDKEIFDPKRFTDKKLFNVFLQATLYFATSGFRNEKFVDE